MMKIHYLEIVTPDIEAVCDAYQATHGVSFDIADASLGGAKTCTLSDGSVVGVRGLLSEVEVPVIRPYWLVEDIHLALDSAVAKGAEIAHPPYEIEGKGSFAIYIQGSIHHGLWQL
jgi:predicted enzyme related to lactoylglutathione lyase